MAQNPHVSPDPALPAPIRSILVVRLSARGDVVFATAMIPALRRAFPHAHLTWVVEAEAKDFVEHNPSLDRVLVLPRTAWKAALRGGRLAEAGSGMARFLRELRSREYDLALDIQGILRSGLVTFLSGARHRMGLGSAEGSGLFMHRVVPSVGHGHRRVSSQYYHLAEELGLDPGDFPMDVARAPADDAFAERVLEKRDLGGFVALVPFTTRPQKHWFEERWSRLADWIRDDMGLTPLFLGGPGDREAMARIREGAEGGVEDLVGKTTLGQAASVLARARGAVGVDTGFTHLSIAFRRPTVTLFGSTLPYTDPPNAMTRILHHPIHCSPCRKNPTCDGAFWCMQELDGERVFQALREVLAVEGPVGGSRGGGMA